MGRDFNMWLKKEKHGKSVGEGKIVKINGKITEKRWRMQGPLSY